MKMYTAVTVDPLPLAEVIEGEVHVFPAGTTVAAFHAGSGRWFVVAKAAAAVWSGTCNAGQLEFRDKTSLGGAA